MATLPPRGALPLGRWQLPPQEPLLPNYIELEKQKVEKGKSESQQSSLAFATILAR